MSDELREEQRFLLESLRDLDREREAGDIDDVDYATLRDGYISRVAAIARSLGESEPGRSESPRPGWKRRILVSGLVVAVGLGCGVLVARQSGQRLPGQSSTGGIEQSTANLLATARQLNFSDPRKSIEIYTQVLKLEPDNPEALTYRAWMLALSAREASGSIKQIALATAVTDLLRAQRNDPSYPDPHCFLGIVYFRFLGDAKLAKPQVDTCKSMNPPQSVSSFVNAISAEVDRAAAR